MVEPKREIAKKLAAKIHRKKWILAASLLMSEPSRSGPGIVKGAGLRHRTNHPATAGMQFIAFYLRRTINWRSSLAPLTSFFASFWAAPKKMGPPPPEWQMRKQMPLIHRKIKKGFLKKSIPYLPSIYRRKFRRVARYCDRPRNLPMKSPPKNSATLTRDAISAARITQVPVIKLTT